jgi:hypothetical protein
VRMEGSSWGGAVTFTVTSVLIAVPAQRWSASRAPETDRAHSFSWQPANLSLCSPAKLLGTQMRDTGQEEGGSSV